LPPYPATPATGGSFLRPFGSDPGSDMIGVSVAHTVGSIPRPMTLARSEKLPARHRMTTGADFAAMRAEGVAFRGALCLLVALRRPGEPTRIGFIASKRGVGGAVERNRARRRLREIVRRRFVRLPETGWLLMFVAHRAAPTAPHQDLASDVERVLSAAGVLAPLSIPDEPPPGSPDNSSPSSSPGSR